MLQIFRRTSSIAYGRFSIDNIYTIILSLSDLMLYESVLVSLCTFYAYINTAIVFFPNTKGFKANFIGFLWNILQLLYHNALVYIEYDFKWNFYIDPFKNRRPFSLKALKFTQMFKVDLDKTLSFTFLHSSMHITFP